MSRATKIIENAAWVWNASKKMNRVRDLIKQEMETTDQSWPIWIHGSSVCFPGDDAVAPTRPPANDPAFTIIN